MHYLMNKNTPCLEIETGKYIDYSKCPISLMLDPVSGGIKYNKIYKWVQQRAVPLSRKNADAIYRAMQLPRDNSETELMYLTHSLSINDNYWIADRKEIGKIRYENISLFRNSFSEAMYLVALKGERFTICGSKLSPEFTGQGSYPKCFVRDSDGIYLVKNQSIQETTNEILACYIAELLGIKTAHYDYAKFSGLDRTKSKILTNEHLNWESAFNMSEALSIRDQTPQEYMLQHYTTDYCNMIIFDALVLNDDRHMKNWSFEINADSNVITGLSASYDYNKAFEANSKTVSTLIFDGNRRINVLEAGRYTYRNYGCTIDLLGLYNIIDELNIKINRVAFKNRIECILGKRESQQGCY